MGGLQDSNKTTTLDESLIVVADGETGSGVKAGVTSSFRLKVDAQLSSGGIEYPTSPIVHQDNYCLNGTSKEMNVNGSVTPVNFTYSPAVNQTWYVDAIALFISDTPSPDFTEFGSIAALTNGMDIKIRTNGTEYTFANIKDNRDISLNFSGQYSNMPADSNLAWLNSAVFFIGFMTFRNSLTLSSSTSDYVRFTVRDNLTGVDHLRSFVKSWRII